MSNTIFDTDISALDGVSKRRAMLFDGELGVRTFRDLLYLYPYRYIDRTRIFKIREIEPDTLSFIQVKARVRTMNENGVGRSRRLNVIVADETGLADMVWFRGIDFVKRRLEIDREYIFFGKASFFNGVLNIAHPEFDIPLFESDLNRPEVYGVYPSTEKLNKSGCGAKFTSRLVADVWSKVSPYIKETLPKSVCDKYGLMGLREALFNIHFPQNEPKLHEAQKRLKFEEFFMIQLSLLRQRNIRISKNKGFLFPVLGDRFNIFYEKLLPFSLTKAQQKVIKEIRRDTLAGVQMNRLLQGDVGSGKTIVAFITTLFAIDNGFQAAIMAPTEILAEQHYVYITKFAEQLNIKVALLTGSTKNKERGQILEALAAGEIHIIIGTHALIENRVQFLNLGYVIIDEQHRFGVVQRSVMWGKSDTPAHILVMTATPIPRTLAMTLYGDLDVSVIDELPPGRKPIKTVHMNDARRLPLFTFIKEEIAKGRQVYIVYPLVKESEKLDYKSVEDGYESITRAFPHPEYSTVIVHGQMSAKDKAYGMDQFKRGEANIMVATTVIEVGVDVPNASVMVIENAERFGLAQLHQLRGRVGRGAEQSYCILMTGDKMTADSRKRMSAMVDTNDGFELAELDLQLRGYGELDGTMQSGNAFDLKIASIAHDSELLFFAREAAEALLGDDAYLEKPENSMLKEGLKLSKYKDFSQIS